MIKKSGKYIALVLSHKQYSIYAYLYLLFGGHVIKQVQVQIDAGRTELEVCGHMEPVPGKYSLCFLDCPGVHQYLSNYIEIVKEPQVVMLESKLMREEGPRGLNAFKTVAAAWKNGDASRITAFVNCITASPNENASEESFKQVLTAAGFTFLE